MVIVRQEQIGSSTETVMFE